MTRRKKGLFILLGLLLTYTLAGFLLLPVVIRHWIIPKALEDLNAELEVASIRTNPFAWGLTMQGFSLQGPEQEEILGFENLYVRLRPTGFFRKTIHFHSIHLDEPRLGIARFKDGRINWMMVFPDPGEETLPTERAPREPLVIPALAIDSFEIREGMVSYRDDSLAAPFLYTISPINLSLNGLNTSPDSTNPYRITARTHADESFSWEGYFNLNPLSSEGTITVQGFNFRHYMPLLENFLPLHFDQGTLDLSLHYLFDPLRERIRIEDGRIKMTDLQLHDPETDTLVQSLESLQVEPFALDLYAGTMEIGTLSLHGGYTLLERNPQGQLNWPGYLLHTAGNEASDRSPDDELPSSLPALQEPDLIDILILTQNHLASIGALEWQLLVRQIECHDWTLSWADHTLSQPYTRDIRLKSFAMESFSNREKDESPFQFELDLADNAALQVRGYLQVADPLIDFDYHLTGFPLAAANPYLEPLLPLVIESGKLNASGWASLMPDDTLPLSASVTFDLWVEAFSVADASSGESLAAWQLWGLYGVQADAETMDIRIQEMKFDEFSAHLRRLPDGQLYLPLIETAEPQTADEPPSDKAETALQELASIHLHSLVFNNGSFIFTDQSIAPEARLTLEQIELMLDNLSWPKAKSSNLAFSALLNRRGRIEGNGNAILDPNSPTLNATVKAAALPMNVFSPYASHYVGLGVRGGALSLELDYRVDSMELDASNLITVERLDFGDRSPGRAVFDLPVKTAVSLLEDRNRRIRLNVPVTGNLRDPSFDLSQVIATAFGSILTNTVTAPFTMIGRLFADRPVEHLDRIDFRPGSAILDDAGREKLAILAEALYERPGLRIIARGDYSTTDDGAALKQRLLIEEWSKTFLGEAETGIDPQTQWEAAAPEERRDWLLNRITVPQQNEAETPTEETDTKAWAPAPPETLVADESEGDKVREEETTFQFNRYLRGSRRSLQNRERVTTTDAHTEALPTPAQQDLKTEPAPPVDSIIAAEGPLEHPDEETLLALVAKEIHVPAERYHKLARQRALACLDFIRETKASAADRFVVEDASESTGTKVILKIADE